MIQTAIETCPVDCIHYIPYEELERLEQERDRMVINYKARLVGSDGLLSSGGAELGRSGGRPVIGITDYGIGTGHAVNNTESKAAE